MWLQREFILAALDPDYGRRAQLTCEGAVLRLHDSWARFCREVIVISAVGRTTTLGGLQLTPCNPAIKKRASVIPILLSTYKKKKYEPKWFDATECIDAGSRLSIVNLSTVSAALGATNSPAEEIKHVRNFYAHRKKGTCMNAAGTNLFLRPTRPIPPDLTRYTSGGNMVIEAWVTDLLTVATAAVQ
jgi:hypothetical protein